MDFWNGVPFCKPVCQFRPFVIDRDHLQSGNPSPLGISKAPLGTRWEGGEVILKPGKEGTQEKRIPIETLFAKVVMIRDKLRVLEQKINASKLEEDEKIDLQSYITGCYGSLTTFNVLFRDRDDAFRGAGGKE